MKRTEVSGMCQNRTEWNGIEWNVKKSAEGWWNKEINCLSVKGAFTQQLVGYLPLNHELKTIDLSIGFGSVGRVFA